MTRSFEKTATLFAWRRFKAQGTPSRYDGKEADGGEKQRCGWLKDKYGLSWQIIPTALGEMLQDKDADKSKRVMEAMLQMDKIDVNVLRRAYFASGTPSGQRGATSASF